MFLWNEIYAVDIKEIDQQHKRIFDLINQLDQAIRLGCGQAILGDVHAQLIDYTKSHFATEEKLMSDHGFPDLEWHVKEHAHLIDKVTALEQRRAAGESQLSVQTLTFLFDWLSHHIMVTDRKYSAYLRARGVE